MNTGTSTARNETLPGADGTTVTRTIWAWILAGAVVLSPALARAQQLGEPGAVTDVQPGGISGAAETRPWPRFGRLADSILLGKEQASLPAGDVGRSAFSSDAWRVFARPAKVTPECQSALDKLADYVAIGSDRADVKLQELGYGHPGIADDLWRSFTPYSKIEAAYVSAETAGEGSGGRMLAMLSESLAREHESARGLVVHIDPLPNGVFGFAQLEWTGSTGAWTEKLTPETRDAIEAASKYCDGGQFGPRTVLAEFCQLDEATINTILRTSRTHSQVLTRGFEALEAAQQEAAMERLISDLCKEYAPAREEVAFLQWRLSILERPLASASIFEPGTFPPGFKSVPPEIVVPKVDLPDLRPKFPLREFVAPERGALQLESRAAAGELGAMGEAASASGFLKRAGGELAVIAVALLALWACGVPGHVVAWIGVALVGIWACRASSAGRGPTTRAPPASTGPGSGTSAAPSGGSS